jgi:hypothetical protein
VLRAMFDVFSSPSRDITEDEYAIAIAAYNVECKDLIAERRMRYKSAKTRAQTLDVRG